jgi:hypothetical protein
MIAPKNPNATTVTSVVNFTVISIGSLLRAGRCHFLWTVDPLLLDKSLSAESIRWQGRFDAALQHVGAMQ